MPSPNGIRAVLFDLDGTLRHNQPTFYQAFFEFAKQLGLPDSPVNRKCAIRWLHHYWAQSPECLADLQAYGGLTPQFWTNHARLNLIAFGCEPKQAETLASEMQRLLTDVYQPEDVTLPDVLNVLRELKGAGFTLGVVSNRSNPYHEQLTSLGLLPYFDLVLAAGEVNSWKPEPGIFLRALERLAIRPEQTLYIGDNYYADVIGARSAGLLPVLLDPDHIFPEADCPVIETMGELWDVLANQHPQPHRN